MPYFLLYRPFSLTSSLIAYFLLLPPLSPIFFYFPLYHLFSLTSSPITHFLLLPPLSPIFFYYRPFFTSFLIAHFLLLPLLSRIFSYFLLHRLFSFTIAYLLLPSLSPIFSYFLPDRSLSLTSSSISSLCKLTPRPVLPSSSFHFYAMGSFLQPFSFFVFFPLLLHLLLSSPLFSLFLRLFTLSLICVASLSYFS